MISAPQAAPREPLRPRALLVPLVVYTAGAAWFTWPLASVAAERIVAPKVLLNDVYLVLWTLSWVGRALLHDPMHAFDGNALHPTPQVIAASEHLLGDMPVFLPVWLATDNAVLALNVLIFTSFVGSALAMHFLVLRWTGSAAAAWVAGAAFAFAPWRADLGRPHLLQVQYLPVVAWGLDGLVRGARWRVAVFTAAVLALQVLCSYYLGYAAYLMAAAFVAAWLVAGERRGDRVIWCKLLVALVLPLVVIMPASLPYVHARSHGGLAPELTGTLLRLWSDVGRPAFILETFCGRGTAALAACGLAGTLASRRGRSAERVRTLCLVLTMLLALALAAGPAGFADGRIAPYTWLSSVVPGFRSLRAPVRFGVLVGFSASVLAGSAIVAFERLLPARVSRVARRPLALLGVAIAAGWAVATPPDHPTEPAPLRAGLSPAHRWLAEHGDGGPLLELPFDRELGVANARAMFVSTYHWLPLLNGYTGYTPAASAFLLAHAQQLPSAEALQVLVDCAGLRWILVHLATDVRRDAWHRLEGVRLVKEVSVESGRMQHDELYEVTAARRDACAGLFAADTTAAGNPVADVGTARGAVDVRPPDVVPSFRESRIAVTLANHGDATWPATAVDPRRRFMVAYSWQPVAEAAEPTPWRRVLLPRDVAPGERIDVQAWVWPPREPGDYRLRVRAGQGEDPEAPLLWEGAVRVEGGR